MTFLFTSESTSGWASLRAAMASALLPEASASLTLRSAERMRERNAMLRVRLVSARRVAFSADLVFATQDLQQFRASKGRVVCSRPPTLSTPGSRLRYSARLLTVFLYFSGG